MRIVGGRFRGRTLTAPKSSVTRPTSDKVRESLFNVLIHNAHCPGLEGARVIDLFAGTGALGLEAISRGATYALFVEDNASARAVIRQNIEDLGLQGVTRLFRRDATRLGPAGARDRYRLAFLDPPYGRGLGDQAVMQLVGGGWLEEGAVIVLEEQADAAIAWPDAVVPFETKTYGDTAVHFAILAAAAGSGGAGDDDADEGR